MHPALAITTEVRPCNKEKLAPVQSWSENNSKCWKLLRKKQK